jgi:predicted TIM-barrel enzyme
LYRRHSDTPVRRAARTTYRGETDRHAGGGTSIPAKFAERGGVDLLIVYNSGRYRTNGRGSLAGVSAIDVEGEAFHDPEADAALFDAIREHLDDDVDLLEYDGPINDEAFARTIAETLLAFMGEP